MTSPEITKTTQDILANMTKGVFELKGAKATTLTPVGLEAKGVPEVPQVFLTNEAIRDIALDLRRQAAILVEVAGGLDQLTQTSTAPSPIDAVVEAEEVKLREAAADLAAAIREREDIQAVERAEPVVLSSDPEQFAKDFAAMQVAAQAAAFTPTVASDEAVCPTHGVGITRKMMGGKTVRMCSSCKWRV